MIPQNAGIPLNPPAGFVPTGTDQTIITANSLANYPPLGGIVFNSDTPVNSPAGASGVIATVSLAAGLLNAPPAGLGGNLRRVNVRAYFSGANNANAKTAAIRFGGVIVAHVLLTASVVARGVVEADITVDGSATQTGQGYGLAATSAVGGAVTASVFANTALTSNLANAVAVDFFAETQTSAADIILTGYQVTVY